MRCAVSNTWIKKKILSEVGKLLWVKKVKLPFRHWFQFLKETNCTPWQELLPLSVTSLKTTLTVVPITHNAYMNWSCQVTVTGTKVWGKVTKQGETKVKSYSTPQSCLQVELTCSLWLELWFSYAVNRTRRFHIKYPQFHFYYLQTHKYIVYSRNHFPPKRSYKKTTDHKKLWTQIK